jgi:ferredoxin
MKIGIFYFSATGITHKIAQQIHQSLTQRDWEVDLLNILYPWNQKKEISYRDFDGCFFGFPVYAGRLPSIAEQWLEQQHGELTPCAMFFTYGGRLLENENQITAFLLKKANFRLVLSSEYLGKHTFNLAKGWNLCEDRPNEADFQVAEKFGARAIRLFQDNQSYFQINLDSFQYHPTLIKQTTQKGPFHPSRMGQSCSMCRNCETECPTQAMDADLGEVDPMKCLKCLHCMVICPDDALKLEDATEIFPIFQKRNHLPPEVVNQKESLVYSHFPEKT